MPEYYLGVPIEDKDIPEGHMRYPVSGHDLRLSDYYYIAKNPCYQLTILIPSLGRKDFINRVIQYYKDYPCTIKIIEDPQKLVKECMDVEIKTPFVVFMGDDDILIKKALDQCIMFLIYKPYYVACNGNAELFSVEGDKAHGKIKAISPYPMRGLEQNTPEERIKALADNYFVNIFSVHRTEVWKQMWATT